MQNIKITNADLNGKGVVGLPDAPGLSSQDMQAKFDEIVLEVVVPKHNELIDELASANGAGYIGADGGTVAGHIADNANPHSVTAGQIGAYTKEETENRISERVTDIGSADMAKSVYDSNSNGIVDDSERLGGELPSQYAKSIDAFSPYTHVKNDTIHNLSGIGDNIKFIASADFADGDTFTVNGVGHTAIAADGEPLSGGCFVSGVTVGCFKNGNTLNFKPGGAGLGIKIIAAATIGDLPANSKEGTVAIITGNAIGQWAFCSTKPHNPRENDVWFQTGNTSAAPVNVLKKNEAIVYGQACSQYISGQWSKRAVHVMCGGAWITWDEYLFHNGAVPAYQWSPGSKNASNSYISNVIHIFRDSNGYYTQVDLTGVDSITANCTAFVRESGKNTKARLFVKKTAPSGTYDMDWVATFDAVTEKTTTTVPETIRVGTGAFNGLNYVGVSVTHTTSGSSSDYVEFSSVKLERS